MLERVQAILKAYFESPTETGPAKCVIDFFESVEIFQELLTGKVVAYVAYFELVSGYRQYILWTKEKCLEHGQKFSKRFKTGPWQHSEDVMCLKTLFRMLIGKFGPKSKELHTAIEKETEAEALADEPPGRLGAIREGHEIEDLYGSDDMPQKKHSPLSQELITELKGLLTKLATLNPDVYRPKLEQLKEIADMENPQFEGSDGVVYPVTDGLLIKQTEAYKQAWKNAQEPSTDIFEGGPNVPSPDTEIPGEPVRAA
jgi:hypothetical protein